MTKIQTCWNLTIPKETHFNHDILYKKEVYYTPNKYRLRGSESRQCPHLHILSPNIKTSVHTIHQIESFSFLPLQLEKRIGWKMLRSQQVLNCPALTWFASFFYPCRVAGVVFLTNGSMQPTANTSYKMSDCYNSTCQVLWGSEVSGYVPSMHGNFISGSVTWAIDENMPTTSGARCEPRKYSIIEMQ